MSKLSDHLSCQSITELPIEGSQVASFLNSIESLRRSLHQKDPLKLFACGGM